MRFASIALIPVLLGGGVHAAAQQNNLANNTVLIVRHAEKSSESGNHLTAQGETRARAYAKYFEPFHEGDITFTPNVLYAGKDSANSMRPRLTLEPLSRTTGMKLDLRFDTKEPETLVAAMKAEKHGSQALISWRHGEIPALIDAFGGRAKEMIPAGKWPDEVYDWVIVLTFDGQGKLASQKLVHEHLDVPAA